MVKWATKGSALKTTLNQVKLVISFVEFVFQHWVLGQIEFSIVTSHTPFSPRPALLSFPRTPCMPDLAKVQLLIQLNCIPMSSLVPIYYWTIKLILPLSLSLSLSLPLLSLLLPSSVSWLSTTTTGRRPQPVSLQGALVGRGKWRTFAWAEPSRLWRPLQKKNSVS